MSVLIRYAVVALCAGVSLPVAAQQVGPTLTLPDGTTLTLPGGPHAPLEHAMPLDGMMPLDPGWPVTRPDSAPPSTPLTAGERRHQRLDALFGRLAGAQDPVEAASLTAQIDALWAQSGSPTADLLLARAAQAIAAKKNDTAGRLLDTLVALRPGWAEAWNKRATVRYLEGDDAGSMADVGHVLALEPRHFGALSGMGYILHRNGDDKGALAVLRRAAEIDPQQADVKALIEELTPLVEGQPL